MSNSEKKDLAPLHRTLLMVAMDVHSFCSQHGIEYYLMGGSALGAARHGGFIPWDDDMDIFMDRENYIKFMEKFEIHGDFNKYYLEREGTDKWPIFFTKLKLNDTLYIEDEEDMGRFHNGIFIDIMCLHNTFDNKYLRFMHYIAARVLTAMGLARRGYKTDSILKKFAMAVFRGLWNTPVKSLLINFIRCLDGRSTRIVGHFFGRAPFHKTSFDRSFLDGGIMVDFSNEKLMAPKKLDAYLQLRYGNKYMELPDQKTIALYPSHMIRYDLGPYREA